jgi:predicted DNA-binding transcriptional regulator AlpA
MPKKLITIKALALQLDMAEQSIYNRTGRKSKKGFPIKPVRVGRSLRFSQQAVDEFIEKGGEI